MRNLPRIRRLSGDFVEKVTFLFFFRSDLEFCCSNEKVGWRFCDFEIRFTWRKLMANSSLVMHVYITRLNLNICSSDSAQVGFVEWLRTF